MAENYINEGIFCTVTNCTYNANGQKCTAHKIEVDSGNAKTAKETCCSTFELKN